MEMQPEELGVEIQIRVAKYPRKLPRLLTV